MTREEIYTIVEEKAEKELNQALNAERLVALEVLKALRKLDVIKKKRRRERLWN